MMGVGLIPSLCSSTEKYFEKHNQKKTPRKYCVSEVPLFSLLLQTLFLHFHYYNFPLFTMSNAARLLARNQYHGEIFFKQLKRAGSQSCLYRLIFRSLLVAYRRACSQASISVR